MSRNYNKIHKDKKTKKLSIYKEDDYILMRNASHKIGENKKLLPKYKKPYLIRKSLGNSRYIVTDIPDNIKVKSLNTILSSDCLKLWMKPVDA